MSTAFQLEKAGRISSITYIQIVIAFIWDFMFFQTKFKSTDIIGSLIIISFIFIITVARAAKIID
jgi:drug/metabolite transporter (DMT)-like permease